MYADMVDVLIYLYENYMDGDTPPPADQHELKEELTEAGFSTGEIDKALVWLDELADTVGTSDEGACAGRSVRIYTEQECRRLDVEARGLLLFLEHNGILDPISRELVVERALALDTSALTVEELKWIVLLVLMNRPGKEAAFSQMEDMVYNSEPVLLH
jgi:Smg protein